jgi:hypothetical protein
MRTTREERDATTHRTRPNAGRLHLRSVWACVLRRTEDLDRVVPMWSTRPGQAVIPTGRPQITTRWTASQYDPVAPLAGTFTPAHVVATSTPTIAPSHPTTASPPGWW